MGSGEWLLNWGCMSLGVMSTFLEAETSVVVQQCPCTKYHWILHIWMVSFTLYEFHLNFLKWKKSLLLHHNQMTWKAAEMWGHVWLGEPAAGTAPRPPNLSWPHVGEAKRLPSSTSYLSCFSLLEEGELDFENEATTYLGFLKSWEKIWASSTLRATWKERQQLDLEK